MVHFLLFVCLPVLQSVSVNVTSGDGRFEKTLPTRTEPLATIVGKVGPILDVY